MPALPYRTYADFLAPYFAGKVQKVSVDAGFSCPNRDGTLGREGCAFCNNSTFSPGYCGAAPSVTEQLRRGMAFFARKYPAMRYLAYFQSYTNTYGPLDEVLARYEEALAVEGVVGVVIGTRPDCVSDALLDALATLHRRRFVTVEYGIESTLDTTLLAVGRGHSYACAADAVLRTAARGIPVGAHLIMGLPGETRAQQLVHIARLSALPLDLLKLHQLQIVRGSRYAREYRDHPERFALYTPTGYVTLVCDALERMRPTLCLDRFTAQAPDSLLIAPRWGMKNYEFAALVQREMQRRGTWQGCRYVEDCAEPE